MGLAWVTASAGRRDTRWFTNGVLTNPTGGTVLANSGVLPDPGEYHVFVVVSASAAAQISIRHRNATDSGDVEGPITVLLGANAPVELFVPVRLKKNERVTVTVDTALTGTIAGSIALFEAYQE
jgi:hypothetical protein